LRLNEVETARAIGVAASRAAGLRCNVGTMVKPLHSGFAARDGLEAALLAQAGATASIDSLEGPFGLFPVLAAGRNPSAGFEQTLGNPFDFIQPGIIFKEYPSCLDTHAAIDAALAIRAERRVHTGEVARIICSLPPGIGDDLVYADPKTLLEGKFSLEFCVALALVRGRVTTTEFADKAIDDPDIREMMRATIVRHDPQLILPEGSFCGSARVEILTRDGGRISKYVEYMSGHPRNPMDASQLRQKLYD
jgi:2-methylcitrate dehydratase PrpD